MNRRTIWWESFVLLLSKVVGAPLQMVTGAIMAVNLGPFQLGIAAIAMAAAQVLVQVFPLGVEASIPYFSQHNPAKRNTVLINGLVVITTAWLVGGAAMFIAYSVGILYALLGDLAMPEMVGLLGVVWISMCQSLLLGAAAGRRRFDIAALGTLGQQLSFFLFISAAAAVMRLSLGGVILAWGGSFVVSSGILGIAMWRDDVLGGGTWWPEWAILQEQITYGSGHVGAVAGHMLMLRGDLFLTKAVMGASVAGTYSVAKSLAEMLLALPASVAPIITASVAGRMGGSDGMDEACRLQRWVSAALVGAVVLLEMGAGQFIPLIYSSTYTDAVAPFRILLIGVPIFGVSLLGSHYLYGMGDTGSRFLASIAGLSMMIGTFAAVHSWGLIGAGSSLILGWTASACVIGYRLVVRTGLPVSRFIVLRKSDFEGTIRGGWSTSNVHGEANGS